MEVLIILLGISLLISGGFLVVFLMNVKSGEYDDTYSPSHKMLFDDTIKPKIKKPLTKNP